MDKKLVILLVKGILNIGDSQTQLRAYLAKLEAPEAPTKPLTPAPTGKGGTA